MKKSLQYLLVLLSLLLPALLPAGLIAQDRAAGQMVVPLGYENQDSIRFGVTSMEAAANPWLNPGPGKTVIDSLADEVGVTFQDEWGGIAASTALTGKRKGIMAYDAGELPSFGEIIRRAKQRIFWALPTPLTYTYSSGFWWRYNDASGLNPDAAFYNNTYDANDISPFSEYPQKHSYVIDTFRTRRFNQSIDSLVTVGNESRVILGMSDDRICDQMLRSIKNRAFPLDTTKAGPSFGPKQFSVNLDFNIDVSNIDTAGANGRSADALPLLRIQVLYKKGGDIAGWPTLPMVPFKNGSNPNNPGWWAIIDQTITKAMYDTLQRSWRSPDTLENGTASHSWNFKQLHLRLQDVPTALTSSITSEDGADQDQKWGQASGQGQFASFIHPDSLCEADNNDNKILNLLEIRVLSTYRSTVRVRSLDFQDTLADKYFYRKLDTSSYLTHSYNPNGTRGGFDDSLIALIGRVSDSLGTRKPREYIINDTWAWERGLQGGLITSAIGLVDFLMLKKNIHVHYREQDKGGSALHTRRNRMSYDGKPPSLYENQASAFYSLRSYDWVKNDTSLQYQGDEAALFPRDYVQNWPVASASTTFGGSTDSMFNILITRSNMTGQDSLSAYWRYLNQYGGGPKDWINGLRSTSIVALRHPKSKRFAVEAALQGWSALHTPTVLDTAYFLSDPSHPVRWLLVGKPWFKFRPTTPEETSIHFWIALANGYSGFTNPQAFDLPSWQGASPGLWGIGKRTSPSQNNYFVHNYNFGHAYAYNNTVTHVIAGKEYYPSVWKSPTNSELDNGIPNWYLGYSNTWRAHKRCFDRTNSFYSPLNSAYPFRRFEWLDAYSANYALNPLLRAANGPADSISRAKAFLQVVKTQPVDPWLRGSRGEYIDKTTIDSTHRTYVEVGLFKDSTVGYSALVVNTRLWPTLNDPVDSIYYNQGLTNAKDRSRSTLGDIDVRKVFLKIDKTKMDSALRSNYYVVRDIEHPDTNWLVKSDSTFAIYLKPGDAKFLYFEPGIAIDVAKNSNSTGGTFGFNNARRVAEREGGKRMVVTYTRNDSLFVSYPAVGTTWEGYNEHSAGDNVATGYEELVDAGPCKWPSVSVGQNDSAVGISYWKRDSTGDRIHFAYQPNYGLAWSKAYNEYLLIPDSNVGPLTSGVTPLSDTSWIVVVNKIAGTKPGLFAARFGITNKTPHFSNSYQLKTAFVPDTILYPTVSSRPLADSLWPVRIAWENRGEISRMALSWSDAQPVVSAITVVSAWLTDCDHENHHPSIALAGHIQVHFNGTADTVMHEDIVWEVKRTGSHGTADKYWIASRYFVQPYRRVAGKWSIFTLFKPDTLSPVFHFPNVSSSPKKEDFFSGGLERLRIEWHNTGKVEGAHWNWPFGWRKTILKEEGFYPSSGQSTDSLEHWSTSSGVPQSLVWVRPDGLNADRVRITNGKYSLVSYTSYPFPQYEFVFYRNLDRAQINCNPPPPPQLLVEPRGKLNPQNQTSRELHWKYSVPGSDNTLPELWSVADGAASQLLVVSDTFSVRALDSIYVPRSMDTVAIDSVKNSLAPGDKLEIRILLMRMRDSVQLATVDSIVFTRTSAIYPGYGLPTSYAAIKLPVGFASDTAFLAITTEKIDSGDVWGRSIVETFPDGTTPIAEKQNKPLEKGGASPLEISVHPNPFNPTAEVNVTGLTPDYPAKIELFDMLGRPMMTLFDGIAQAAELRLTLDGSTLASGSYMLRVQTPTAVRSSRVQLIK